MFYYAILHYITLHCVILHYVLAQALDYLATALPAARSEGGANGGPEGALLCIILYILTRYVNILYYVMLLYVILYDCQRRPGGRGVMVTGTVIVI